MSAMRHRVWFLVAISVVSLPLTAAGQRGQASILIGQWQPAPGQRCEPVSGPFPSFGAMFDSAAVAQALADAADTGAVVLSAAMYLAGPAPGQGPRRNDTLWVVESTLPDSSVTRVRATLRRYVQSGVDDMVLLRIDLGSRFAAATASTLQCAPVLQDEVGFRAALEDLGRRGLRGSAVAQLIVNRDGTVRRAALERSSGNQELDAALIDLAGRLRYYPALVNGRAVPLGLRLPLRIN